MIALAGYAGAPAQASAPTVFAPNVISGPAHETAPAFTPDGKTVYFSRGNNAVSTILVSRRTATGWSTPVPAPFSGEWLDMEPAMAPDGSFLVFASSRPIAPGGPLLDGTFGGTPRPGHGGHLWRVDRRGEGWTTPVHLPASINRTTATFAPAVVRDGSIYFMEAAADGKFGVFRAQRKGDGYEAAVRVAFSEPRWNDVDPAVAADESYAVFSSSRPPTSAADGGDLFIVRRASDGSWATPVHLGAEVNSPNSEAEARLSPDGRTLYFSSNRVVPVKYPRSHADAVRDVERLSWDNTLYNIWQVDLSPWLSPRG
ncbi:MAG: hypothetical protein ABIY55_07795 [Kofleriaceae bacterium]